MARLLWPELSAVFDEQFYNSQYPDVAQSGIDPLAHFLLFGGPEGRQPGPWFEPEYYLAANPDVARAKANPLLHFLRYGWKENRPPSPLFDQAFYRGKHPGKSNPFIDFARRWKRGERVRGALPFTLPSCSYQIATAKNCAGPPVDIIIPIYTGLKETQTCLTSITRANCRTPYRVILINDASPDQKLCEYLRSTAAAHDWILIENPENLGFAASVNRGIEIGPDRDILLLNNDTEVANDWLDRMANAVSDDRIGTVTPFSNHATLASYPKPNRSNLLPAKITTAQLDALFRQVNAGCRVEIPTAVGFCMYIRRACLRETGGFRPEIFGKGYGEENDFCLRSLYIGWKHVLAADVFVYHTGETSFGDEAAVRRAAAVEKLDEIYPDYRRMLAEHDRRDPLKPFRVAVSAERIRTSGKPVILSITHRLGGGVSQYVRELQSLLSDQATILSMSPTESGAVFIQNLDPADDFRIAFDPELDYREMIEFLRRCGVSRLHVQHLAGHTVDVSRIRRDLNAALDISIHDYFFVCSRLTLTDANGMYCGEPGCPDCRGRIDQFTPLLNAADRVIAPSHDAAARMERYFPEAKVIAAAHSSQPEVRVQPIRILRPDSPLAIGVLGTLSPHKGLDRLRACAALARKAASPLRFVLIGDVKNGAREEAFSKTGPYNNDAAASLIRENGIDVIWFPAQWPETFSYTLSICIEAGLPVIAPDLGSFTERLDGREWSWIVPHDLAPDQMVEFFVRIRREHFIPGMSPHVIERGRSRAIGDFYPVQYLQQRG